VRYLLKNLRKISLVTLFFLTAFYGASALAINSIPTPNTSSPEDIITQYYNNQNNHPKTITIVNNTSKTIYPVVRAYSTSDKHEYRIYVGYADNAGKFSLGVPPKKTPDVLSKAIVYIPPQLWDAGRVEIFDVIPSVPTEDIEPTALHTFDQQQNSINYGDLIYRNDKAIGFPLDAPSQLVEYTLDPDMVDYDVSYVDHLYMPVALEVDEGTLGYMGSGISLENMQTQLEAFVRGEYTNGYFAMGTGQNIGWPFFYNSSNPFPAINGGPVKLPAAYNIFALSDSRSTYDPSNLIKMLQTNQANQDNNDQAVLDGLVNRWLGWVYPSNYRGDLRDLPPGIVPSVGYFATNCGDDTFCKAFADTVNHVWPVAWEAVQQKFPQLKDEERPYKVVEEILGYDFPASFNHDAPIYSDNQDSFRDAVKSLLRGVPYPFDKYPQSQWYPDPRSTVNGKDNPNQKYNLDPIVWFVHKQLGMAGYGFSIDDDTGNVQTPGKSFTIAVGGLDGLKNKTQYDADTQQAVLISPGWTAMESTSLGGCKLNQGTGTDCPVSVRPEVAKKATVTLSTQDGSLTFTLTHGKLNRETKVYPLVMEPGQCKVKGLDPSLCSSMSNDPKKPQFFLVPSPSVVPPPPPVVAANLYFAPGWSSINGCGINASDLEGAAGARPFNSKTACTITLMGVVDTKTTVVATIQAVFNTEGYITSASCQMNGNTCKTPPFISPKGDVMNIAQPVDLVPAPVVTAYLYYAPGWDSISGCGIDITPNGAAGAKPFSNSGSSCTLTLKGMDPNLVATMPISFNGEGRVVNVSCEGTSCNNKPAISPDGAALNLAPPG
jgi:hypothetical protein